MRPIIEKASQLEKHSSWRQYQRGLKELRLLEAPESTIYEYQCQAAQECFLAFVDVMMKGELVVEPFHEIIGAAFEDIANLRYKRLIISCAPRSGKSMLSQHFIAWLFGKEPNISNIIGSYSRGLSGTFQRGIMNILKKPHFMDVFPDFPGFDRRMPNTLLGGGCLRSTSPGSELTGYTSGSGSMSSLVPGVMMIDDALKSAESKAEVQKLKPWWGSEASTRRTNNWAQINIGTRWLVHDLHGILLNNDGIYHPLSNPMGWRYINFEAICENPDTDPLERELDETHWPSNPIFSYDSLIAQKNTMGASAFAALYQGNPIASEGSIFKGKFFRVGEAPECDIKYVAVDTAFSENQSADETAITVFGIEKPEVGKKRSKEVWVLDQVCGRWSFPDLLEELQAVCKLYSPTHLVIERAASGISLIQVLQKDTKLNLDPPNGYKATKSKAIRLQQTLPLFESYRVMINKGAWNKGLKDQLVNFPYDEHDDKLDSMVWGLIYYQEHLDQYRQEQFNEIQKLSRNWKQSIKKEREGLFWEDSRKMGDNHRTKGKRVRRRKPSSVSPDWR